MREIVMELRDLKHELDPIEVKWEVEDNPLGLEWFYALKQNFIGPEAMCPSRMTGGVSTAARARARKSIHMP